MRSDNYYLRSSTGEGDTLTLFFTRCLLLTSLRMAKVCHLVLDSGAFIQAYHLQDFADKFYTIREVIDEIKDKGTKQRLQSLPFELTFVEPSQQDIQHVVDFSKKTGDYQTLSVVDLKLLAVTSYLQRLHVSDDHLTREPSKGRVVAISKETGRVIGFQPEAEVDAAKVEEEVDDDKGWITPQNVAEMTQKLTRMSFGSEQKSDVPKVACMTADFAMQNVLLQSGLGLVSVSETRVINRTNHFILRCFACRATTADMAKTFCPGCGNLKTLRRVAVSINDKGEKEIHINFRKPIRTRGLNQSLPAPRGGKHSNNPVLVEDQPIPQHKACRAALKEKKLTGAAVIQDPDYVLRSNPFAMNDVHSRAARHNYIPGRGGRK